MTTPPGILIVIEGGDAVGKHTQSGRLISRLEDHWRIHDRNTDSRPLKLSFPRYETAVGKVISAYLKEEVILRREPGGDAKVFSEAGPLVLQSLMSADKFDAAYAITSKLAHGGHVVLDRWWQSAYVYGTVDGLDPEWLLRLHSALPKARLNILLDLPAAEAIKRRPEARDRYEANIAHRTRINEMYGAFWKTMMFQSPDTWVIIDGHKSDAEISREIWAHVEAVILSEARKWNAEHAQR